MRNGIKRALAAMMAALMILTSVDFGDLTIADIFAAGRDEVDITVSITGLVDDLDCGSFSVTVNNESYSVTPSNAKGTLTVKRVQGGFGSSSDYNVSAGNTTDKNGYYTLAWDAVTLNGGGGQGESSMSLSVTATSLVTVASKTLKLDSSVQKVANVDWGNLTLTVVTENDGKTSYKDSSAFNDSGEVTLKVLTEGAYDYTLTSDNYTFSAVDVDEDENTVSATVTPKYTIGGITLGGETASSMCAGESKTLGVTWGDGTADAWKNVGITYTVDPETYAKVSEGKLTCAGLSTEDDNDQTVKVTAQLTGDSEASRQYTKEITLKKQEVTLEVSRGESTKFNDFKVIVTAKNGNDAVPGLTISLKSGSFTDSSATDEDNDGKVTFSCSMSSYTSPITVTAASTRTAVYAAASKEAEISFSKEDVAIGSQWELTPVANVNVTYGDGKTAIATITKKSDAATLAGTTELKLVGTDSALSLEETDGSYTLYLTPEKYVESQDYEIQASNDNYNFTGTLKSSYSVAKKQLTANNFTFVVNSRPYDGTKTFDNISVTIAEDALVTTEEKAAKTMTVSGEAGSKDVGTEIALTVKWSDLLEKADYLANYELAEEATSVTKNVAAITQKELTITVHDAEKAYRAEATLVNLVFETLKQTGFVTENGSISYVTQYVTVAGFVDEPKNFVAPGIAVDGDKLATESTGTCQNAVILSTKETGSATANYKFSETVDYGDVKITDEKVEEDSLSRYLTVGGTGVYAKDFKNVYVAKNNKVTFTLSSEMGYTKIYRVEGETGVNVTNGETISGSGAKKYYLTCEDEGTESFRSETFTITYIMDSTNPTATIEIGAEEDSAVAFARQVTFGRFQKDSYTAQMGVSDNGSGVKTWQYYVVQQTADLNFTSKTVDEVVAALGTKEATVVTTGSSKAEHVGLADSGVEDGNYVVFVYVEDNVGNKTLVGSNGMIVDDVQLDSLTVTLEGSDGSSGKEVDGVYYFNSSSVTVTTNAKEAVSDNKTDSGVAYIKAKIVEDSETTNKTLYPADDDTLPSVDDPVSLEKLANTYQDVTESLVFKQKSGASKTVKLIVSSRDLAGNDELTVTKDFVIDGVAPKVTLTRKTDATNGKYYNKNVKFVTKVTERYVDIREKLKYTITVDKEDSSEKEKNTYTLQQLLDGKVSYIKATLKEGDSSDGDDRTYTITLTFKTDKKHKSDAAYKISATVTDLAGNKTKSDANEFVIDTTAPEIKHVYELSDYDSTKKKGGTEDNPTYINNNYDSFTANLTVTEKHLDVGKSRYSVEAKDASGEYVALPEMAENVSETTDWDEWAIAGVDDTWKKEILYTDDANYSFTFSCQDLAGNKASFDEEYVTLDMTKPTGSVKVTELKNGTAKKVWKKLLKALTFGYYGADEATATLSSSDATSGLKATYYLTSDTLLEKWELKESDDWKKYSGKLKLKSNRNIVVYEKLVDKAGNVNYISSDRIVMDNVDPSPEITITPSKASWGKGVYSAKDNPGFDIEVTDPENNDSYSGLKKITYTIKNGTTGKTETGTLEEYETGSHIKDYSGHVSIDPSKFYSNDVQITVSAEDFSENAAVSETSTLKIDNEAPKVTFSFDKSGLSGDKYYNTSKTLTITVQERNFDTSYTPKVTGSTKNYSFSGWSSKGETHTGKVTFNGDGDFSVTFECYDLAGNKSNSEKMDEITIDKTKPEISVSYDNDSAQNGEYYKASRRATITVKEHNFSSSDVNITVTADLDGKTASLPDISGWSGSGDTYTATIRYDDDADYTFTISAKDKASNAAEEFTKQSFTVDQTAPEITVTGVEENTAYKSEVAPQVTVSDINLDSDNVKITLTGANKGLIDDADLYTMNQTDKSKTVSFKNFGDDMDDVYTLDVTGTDKAGNSVSQTLKFSVNRHGSNYVMADNLKELIDKGYTNDPQDVVVTETNVNEVTSTISCSRDGEVVTLAEGTDYEVTATGDTAKGFQYVYKIFGSCFGEEGGYSLEISSKDSAGNMASTVSKEVNVQFVVDKTSPVMQVSNLEDGATYNESSHDYVINVSDNAALTKVEVYLDGVLQKTYEGEELDELNGAIPEELAVMQKRGVLTLKAYDAADNPATELTYSVLVTTNLMVRLMDSSVLFGIIAAIAVLLILFLILLMKRRKKEAER